MQRSLTLAALTLMLTGTAVAQTSAPRVRPMATIPNTQVKPGDLQKKLVVVPRFLTPGELAKGNANLVGKMFSQPFTLSAAVQSVPNRGSVSFDNSPQFFVPQPLPPGSGGQVTVRNKQPGSGNQPPIGAIKLTINAAPNRLYAIDCVATVEGREGGYLNYWLEGGASNSRGSSYPKQGHYLFDVRGAATMQEITLYIFPNPYKKGTNPMVGDFEVGYMDFYGCQITPES